jgi:predicted TIM-barrel enzyme
VTPSSEEQALVPWETTEERSVTRASILAALRKTIAAGKPVIGAGASIGIVARSAEAGGADLIIVYSTGKTRIWGLPTTPLLHSNPVTLSMYDEIDNVVDRTPIIGGAQAGDPTYRRLPRLVRAFRDQGFDGIINFPSAGVDPVRAAMREHVGQGLRREAEMIRLAREQDYFTMSYSYTAEQARINAAAGVDIQVAHTGWTEGGESGRIDAPSLQRSAELVQEFIEITRREHPDCICLAHGGSIATPEDTTYLYEHSDAQGFVGASSIERIPIERAVKQTVTDFKNQKLRA